MTIYQRPTKLTQMVNGLVSWLASLGVAPSNTVTLEVRGRRSGQVRSTAVIWVEHDGERYLVSPRGESEWVRNVRAAGGDAVIRHRGRKKVHLEELAPEQREPVIQTYLRKTASMTRQHFGVDPKANMQEFERIAPRHPVFRIVDGGG